MENGQCLGPAYTHSSVAQAPARWAQILLCPPFYRAPPNDQRSIRICSPVGRDVGDVVTDTQALTVTLFQREREYLQFQSPAPLNKSLVASPCLAYYGRLAVAKTTSVPSASTD